MAKTFKKSKDKNILCLFAEATKSLQFKVYMIYSSHVGCKEDQEMNHRRKLQKTWKNIIFKSIYIAKWLGNFEYFIRFAVLLYLLNQ